MAVDATPQEGTKSTSLSTTLLWVVLGLVLLADALDMIDSTVTNIAAADVPDDGGRGNVGHGRIDHVQRVGQQDQAEDHPQQRRAQRRALRPLPGCGVNGHRDHLPRW